MKKLSLVLISLLFLFQISQAKSYSTDPEMLVSELVNEAISKLSNKNLSKEEKKNFIENIALENVDIKALGMYTLGELRKSLDQDSLDKYHKSFQKYFLKSLTSRLTDYSSNKFEIIGAEKKSAVYTIVKSKILASDKQPEIKIDWRVYTKDTSKPLIRDLIVEGLSLARTQKEEFSSIIQSNDGNINALFSNLKEFIK